jgi:hypothetical protein
MDWNKGCLLLAQVAVVIVLGALVATGHDSMITDGLMVVCGSIAGTSIYQAVTKK